MSIKTQVLPSASPPRPVMKCVRNTRAPSRMKAFVPAHSLTPKSASKLSGMVYHGIFQPIWSFSCAISGWGARGEYERDDAGIEVREIADMVGEHRAPNAG